MGTPIKVDQTIVKGGHTPLDAFAVAIAVSISLMFVTLLLAAGVLALEREENAFLRLVRGLVSRTGLLVEKVSLAAVCAVAVSLLMLAGISLFVTLAWGRFPLWLLALAAGRARLRGDGGGDRRRHPGGAGRLAARVHGLPADRLSRARALRIVSEGAVSGDPRDLGAVPFKATLQAMNAALNSSGGIVRCPLIHLAILTLAFGVIARVSLRRFGLTGSRLTAMAFPATRMRRLRQTGMLRDMVRETELRSQPPRLPDVRRARHRQPHPDRGDAGHRAALDLPRGRGGGRGPRAGHPAVLLFGIPGEKDEQGCGAYDEEGVVQLAVRAIKEALPELVVITDVCLCEYTSHGHCGVVRADGTWTTTSRSSCSPRPPSRTPRPAPTSSRRAT